MGLFTRKPKVNCANCGRPLKKNRSDGVTHSDVPEAGSVWCYGGLHSNDRATLPRGVELSEL